MTNKDFHKAIDEFLPECFDLISHALKESEHPVLIEPEVMLNIEGVSTYSKTVIDWAGLIYDLEDKIVDLDSYKKMQIEVEKDSILSKHFDNLVGTSNFKTRLDMMRFVVSVCLPLLTGKNQPILNKIEVQELYKKIEKFFYSETIKYRFIAPIDNFDANEVDKIKLDKNISIIKITNEIANSITGRYPELRPFTRFRFPKFAFESIIEVSKEIGDKTNSKSQTTASSSLINESLDQICIAFRLFKPGRIIYNDFYSQEIGWSPIGGMASTAQLDKISFGGPLYMLETKKEVSEFLKFWEFF